MIEPHNHVSAESGELTDRLRNPFWAHSNVPFESPQLEQEENIAAMNEAAAEIERLRRVLYEIANLGDGTKSWADIGIAARSKAIAVVGLEGAR